MCYSMNEDDALEAFRDHFEQLSLSLSLSHPLWQLPFPMIESLFSAIFDCEILKFLESEGLQRN